MMCLKISTLLILSIFLLGTARPQIFDGTVEVCFNEWMDTTGFSNPNNFVWTGGLVTTDVELIDTALAELTISEPEINQWYTLEVFNVYDLAGNLINPEKDTTGFMWKELALPVELSSFTAKVIDERVHLKWITKTEVSNYGFYIERTTDNSDWKAIGFVEGHGNSNSPKSYLFVDMNPSGGSKFKYRLKQIDTDGKYEYSDEIEVDIILIKYTLYQNYPNPFNPTTTIKFALAEKTELMIAVYNLLGEKVAEVFSDELDKGYHEVEFNAATLSSGIYFYRFESQKFVSARKMIIMK